MTADTAVLKIEGGKLKATAAQGLAPYVEPMANTPGKRLVGIVELQRIKEMIPDPSVEDVAPEVTVRISQLEIADPDSEEYVRRAMRMIYLTRTADGTLTADGDVELSETTLSHLAGILSAEHAAKLRTVVKHWDGYLSEALATGAAEAGAERLREVLRQVRDGLHDALLLTEFDEQEDAEQPGDAEPVT